MKTIYKQIFLIFLLFIMILIITNLLNIKSRKSNTNKIIPLTKNHMDASFVTNEYISEIKNTPKDIDKYLTSVINPNDIDTNNFFADEPNLKINKPFIETFTSIGQNINTPSFLTKIDKILYINLDHRQDRDKQITNEFKKMKFPQDKIQRVSAIREKYNGHIGCCKSHIKVMDEIINNDYKYTMVFEDDFVFSVDEKTLNSKMNNFFKTYKNEWDIIQLASVYVNLKDTKTNDIKKVESASTSSAYIINRKFAKVLKSDLQNSLKLMEKEMKEFNKKNNNVLKKKFETRYALDQHWYSLQKKSDWYIFKPYIGKQGGEAVNSSIMSTNIEGFSSRTQVKFYSLKC